VTIVDDWEPFAASIDNDKRKLVVVVVVMMMMVVAIERMVDRMS
jgi:hypothetical protein